MKKYFWLLCLIQISVYSQNNKSRTFPKTKIKADFVKLLSDSIPETSGLIAFDNLLWTHNDDHDTTLYGLDESGKIRKKIKLPAVVNQDWEEISQDENYIYIGDFGNNYQGNRTNLHISKYDKKTIFSEKPACDTISFSYENQTDFSPQSANTTNFDCEAFVVYQDSIYLFTKEWKTLKTTIYSLSNTPGNHIAKAKATLDVKGLVTGATFSAKQNSIVLCGYSKRGKTFLYLLFDFKNADFFDGKKRKIKLKLPFHQIEGIATFDGINYYISNEHLQLKPIINVPQKLHRINLGPFLDTNP